MMQAFNCRAKKWEYVEPAPLTDEEIAEFERQQANMPELTPAEQREMTYNTDPIIPWCGAMLTVTEVAQKWQYYAAEGDTAKMDALTALIAAAKASIREKYPDTDTKE